MPLENQKIGGAKRGPITKDDLGGKGTEGEKIPGGKSKGAEEAPGVKLLRGIAPQGHAKKEIG